MNEQEAIRYIEQHGFISDEAKDMAIKALEKQMPKKPRLVQRAKSIIEFYPCPTCSTAEKYEAVYPKQKHCTNCGQKLDWSV